VLYGVGQGAILPVIALSARQLGASLATAGLVVALAGVGQIAGDLPAGQLAARYGERRAMLGATALSVIALVGCALAPSVAVLGASVLCLGVTGAVWGLARQAYLTDAVPVAMRARALSTLGGTHRIGMFVGPFVGALAVDRWGISAAYWVHVATAALACAALVLLPELERRPGAAGGEAPGLVSVVRTHLPVLRTLGIGVLLVGAARASRQVVVPLWAEQLGLSPAATSLVFGVSGAVDMLLFYPAGHVMDRYGRAFIAVPSMVVLGVAHLLLPLATEVRGLLLAAVLMGLGNGMGSGLVMTLGADASPATGRSQFLGAWRLCADAGNAAGPLAVSAVAAASALAPAVLVMGGVSFVAAAVLARWVPRFDPVDRGGAVGGRR
jgi:MFS family permease